MIKNTVSNFKRYRFLLAQLISRDFKVKYKRSVLGVLWSLLYPVLMTLVMSFVYSNVFKVGKMTANVDYTTYLMIGLTLFNYFSEASNLAMSSVVANFSLINKVYIPKYIFPMSKVLFSGINFLLTLIPLYAVILISGTGLNWYHLLLPYAYACLFIFTLGMGLILSTVAVFLRDMFYIYGIVLTIWTYLTPIMYDMSVLQLGTFSAILKCNPLYQYINFARAIILHGWCPTLFQFVSCFATAFGTLLIGAVLFRKNQDKFIYYV